MQPTNKANVALLQSRFLRFLGGSGAIGIDFTDEFETEVDATLEPCVK
jgi:hypothetical protein